MSYAQKKEGGPSEEDFRKQFLSLRPQMRPHPGACAP